MENRRRSGSIWYLVLIGLVALLLAALPLIVLPAPSTRRFVLRAAPLLGYQALFLAIVLAAYPERVRGLFGSSFLGLHHALSKLGLILVSVHAVVVALDFATATVFIPRLDSLRGFVQWGGSPSWLLLFIGTATAYFPKVFRRTWRPLHYVTYIAFYLATTHGLLLGIDFQRPVAKVVILSMAAIVTFVFLHRQWRAATRRRSTG
ncbi:MAG: ferric reductase-like transmembrane domain-containing protein [Anaerolineae bacterium]